jgi:signal transduction histidine kinase/CheY-like chemotaxis protein/HPt (histidine-containing phosphotransfer) domain-containing protein
MDELYRYRIDNIEARNVLLLKFEKEFADFRVYLHSSFYNADWMARATDTHRNNYSRFITQSYEDLGELSRQYIASISEDELFIEHLVTYSIDDLIRMMNEIMSLVNDSYQKFNADFLSGEDYSGIGMLDFSETIDDYIRRLSSMDTQVDENIQAEIEETLALNRRVTVIILGLTVIFSLVLSLLTVKSFANWAKKIEATAIQSMKESSIAEENSQAKTRFLAHMSHEIRTPISAVICVAEIQLHNPNLSKEVEEAFNMIYSSSSVLIGILNDILDLSKIEAGKFDIIDGEYEVAGLLQDVLQMHTVALDSKKFKFNVLIDGSLPAVLVGDILRLKQVLNNLISNAFKYTEDGTVEFSVKRMPHPTDGMINMMVTISDTGRGMTEDQIKKLLSEEYSRFHEAEARNIAGTGLGMPIVINLLELMGAHIDIQSYVGEGTKITLMIPQQSSLYKELGVNTAKNLANLESTRRKLDVKPISLPHAKILVVDDVATNLFVAKGMLGLYNIVPETCEDGMSAINKIKNGSVYDILFMDHMMPELNGIDATKILRDIGYTHPVIALTANAFAGQEEEFLSNGFDGYIAKPIQSRFLHETILKYVPLSDEYTYEYTAPEADSDEKTETGEIQIPEPAADPDDYYNSPEIMAMAREEFLESQANSYPEIIEALEKNDMETARRLAHTVKSMANVLKEIALAKASEAIESIIYEGGEPTAEQLQSFEKEMNDAVARMQET